jgi:hypothetical protein
MEGLRELEKRAAVPVGTELPISIEECGGAGRGSE